ncbi:hypothetical protein SAMN05421754_1001223 [Nitrosomonas sp. Nm58]|nr:hypothetical protein SAMN05421754_1001223 [Nitrosomonas sp. Nm58]
MPSEALELFFFRISIQQGVTGINHEEFDPGGESYKGTGVLWCIFTKAHRMPTKIPISTKQQA